MSWWGKMLGGAFGFLSAGPIGALLGVAAGHMFDRGMSESGLSPAGGREGRQGGDRERVQAVFFATTFSVMGCLAKIDGRVTRNEISLAESIMDQMDLSSEQRRAAIDLFREGKKADFPLDEVLAQFKQEIRGRRDLERMFIEILVHAAFADGSLHEAERRLLLRICRKLRFSAIEFQILVNFVQASQADFGSRAGVDSPDELDRAYQLLNVSRDASDEEIKKAYRRLMNRHHPDKLVAKGLPEEMIRLATQKTHEIRQAYERVRRARGAGK